MEERTPQFLTRRGHKKLAPICDGVSDPPGVPERLEGSQKDRREWMARTVLHVTPISFAQREKGIVLSFVCSQLRERLDAANGLFQEGN
ncbi:hypothetical protein CDAR_54881 [Caerostris darwini]|uniref:Uncharacterized protein n=1 Tax=Caerostris darwini TaxID=1538125 RepID=A0AAV4NGA2_9ARAC|nr:hypothetical protein CDAR_54881 [Caerostris darwini]